MVCYLEVRCAYAIAKLKRHASERFGAEFCLANSSSLSDGFLNDQAEQVDSAQCLGWRDAQDGCDDQVPFLFADEPVLSAAWQRGVDQYRLIAHLENCTSCRTARFDPCPSHG